MIDDGGTTALLAKNRAYFDSAASEALNAGRMVTLCNAMLKEFFPTDRIFASEQKLSRFLKDFLGRD